MEFILLVIVGIAVCIIGLGGLSVLAALILRVFGGFFTFIGHLIEIILS